MFYFLSPTSDTGNSRVKGKAKAPKEVANFVDAFTESLRGAIKQSDIVGVPQDVVFIPQRLDKGKDGVNSEVKQRTAKRATLFNPETDIDIVRQPFGRKELSRTLGVNVVNNV